MPEINFVELTKQIGFLIIGYWARDIYEWTKNECKPKKYIWRPEKPLINPNANKDISKHPKDYRIDFKSNYIENIGNCVQGEEALLQHLIKYINTPKGKYKIYEGTSYGNEQAQTIFTEKNLVEFQRQCERMMIKILKEENYVDYIEEVYSVERKRDELHIALKLCGNGNSSLWIVPKLKK